MDVSINDCKEVSCNWKKTKNCDEDFISELPNEILVHILSFMPIKDAIITAFLRRRFRNLWRQIRALDFGQCIYHYFLDLGPGQDEHCFNFKKFICRLMDVLESDTLDKLSFKFDFFFTLLKDRRRYENNESDAEWEKGIRDHLEKLITYALRKKVKVMEFDLRDGEKIRRRSKCYNLPDVLSSDYLTHLTVSAVDMKLCKTADLKALKVMSLDQVTLTDEVMRQVLTAGCPLLEELSLVDCYGLTYLVCKNPNLKRVMITLTFMESPALIISCPHVLSFDINGWVERVCLLRASSTVDVSIFSSRFRCTQHQPGTRRLLKELRKCWTFRPCLWTILVLSIWNLRKLRCPSFEWRNLILKLGMTKFHHPGLSLLLRNSKFLETLTMNLYPESCAASMLLKEPASEWIKAYEFDMDRFWDSQEASFPSLKTITINGCLNEPYVMDIIVFLLKSAPKLEKLVLLTQNLPKLTSEETHGLNGLYLTTKQLQKCAKMFTSEQLQQLLVKLKLLPRASPEAAIYLS